MFSCKFDEVFKKVFITENLRAAASVSWILKFEMEVAFFHVI